MILSTMIATVEAAAAAYGWELAWQPAEAGWLMVAYLVRQDSKGRNLTGPHVKVGRTRVSVWPAVRMSDTDRVVTTPAELAATLHSAWKRVEDGEATRARKPSGRSGTAR